MKQSDVDRMRDGVDPQLVHLLGDVDEEEFVPVAPQTAAATAIKSSLDVVPLEFRDILGLGDVNSDEPVVDDSFASAITEDNSQDSLALNEFFKAGLIEAAGLPRPKPLPVPRGLPAPNGHPPRVPYPVTPPRPSQGKQRLLQQVSELFDALKKHSFVGQQNFTEAKDSALEAVERMWTHEVEGLSAA